MASSFGACPDECPKERLPDVHFRVPNISLGALLVPPFLGPNATVLTASWVGHDVTCGLLWYAWGVGTSPGHFSEGIGGELTGPRARGSSHDWYIAVPREAVPLRRRLENLLDGQAFYVTVRVKNRDGQGVVSDAAACCEDPARFGLRNGTAAQDRCCAAARGATGDMVLTSSAIMYETSPPKCRHAPCVAVDGLTPGGKGRKYTYHPPTARIAVRPFYEPSSGPRA